jgi:hypothetical protein
MTRGRRPFALSAEAVTRPMMLGSAIDVNVVPSSRHLRRTRDAVRTRGRVSPHLLAHTFASRLLDPAGRPCARAYGVRRVRFERRPHDPQAQQALASDRQLPRPQRTQPSAVKDRRHESRCPRRGGRVSASGNPGAASGVRTVSADSKRSVEAWLEAATGKRSASVPAPRHARYDVVVRVDVSGLSSTVVATLFDRIDGVVAEIDERSS